MENKTGESIFLGFALAAIMGLIYVFAPTGLASNEEAVQYVQMKNFVLKGTLEIDSPAFNLGFGAEDVAGPRGLFESRDGRLFAVAPPIFPWVASTLYPLLGEKIVDFTPVLFVFLSVLFLGLIMDRLMKRDFLYYLLLAAFILGSPVFIQGFLFSGMTLALFLIVSALWLLVSHFVNRPAIIKLLVASLLMGASVLVRPEFAFVVFSFHLGAAIILATQRRVRELWAALAGFALIIAMIALHDVMLHGRFPGPYLQMFHPVCRLSPIRAAILGGALAASCVMFIMAFRDRVGPVHRVVLTFLPVVALLVVIGATAARISLYNLIALFPAVILVFFGVSELLGLQRREGIFEGILAAAIVICLLLGAAILHPGEWVVSTVWVPMIPLAIVLIAMNRKAIFATEGMSIVLTFFIGVALVNGIQDSKERILKYRAYNAARVDFIGKHTSDGDVILFSDIGSRDHAGPLFFERVFIVAKSPHDEENLVRQLRKRGVNRVYVWTVNPMSVKGFNPYGAETPPAFPFPSGTKSCCSGNCREGSYYLVKLGTQTQLSAVVGRRIL